MLNILIVLKTLLYINITNIEHNRILILLITSLTTISWLSFVDIFREEKSYKGKVLIYSLISLIIFGDSLYFLQFNMLPSVKLLGQVKLLGSVTDAIYTILNFKNLLLIVDLPFVLLYYFRKKTPAEKLNIKYPLVCLGLVLVFTFASGSFETIKAQELYTYHILDLVKSIRPDKGQVLSQEDLEDLKARTKLKEGKLTGVGRGKNLIVIQVEALQNFVVDLKYQDQEITPNINALIRENGSLYYDRYYQLVGRGNTSDAEFVSNNSLHPAMDQPSYTSYEKNTFYGLPWILRDNNYRTVAMHGYRGDFWNRKNAYKYQGYEEFLDQDFYQAEEIIGMGISDREFFEKNIAYLKDYSEKNDQAFYSFMVTLTSHTPFKMEEKFEKIELEDRYQDSMVGDYLQSIHYLDEQIGYFMELLKESGLYEDTVVAIYGDHFAIKASDERESQLMTDLLGYRYDFDTMMNIPLIIHLPNEDINEKVSMPGSQIDFYPTILNIMGYENQKGLMFGRDLNNYKGENTVKPQTYMKKGSFIKDDIVFEIARDGIFEHSRAYDVKTRAELDINKYRNYYEQAIYEINMGDYISKNNLLKEYMETGSIDLNRQENLIRDYVEIEDMRDLENLDLEKISGIRVLIDNENLGQIISLAREKDLDLILAGDSEYLFQIYDEYDLGDQIVEIKDIEDYIYLTNDRYSRVVLDPYPKNYSKKNIREFIKMYPNLGLELEPGDVKKYKGKNITVYRKG